MAATRSASSKRSIDIPIDARQLFRRGLGGRARGVQTTDRLIALTTAHLIPATTSST
jgi:hypothetical protein